MSSRLQESGSYMAETDYLRKENERLRQDLSYLNRKCEELMSGQNDDAMTALLKNRINDLDKYVEEIEKQHEEQIHTLKLERNAAQKESNNLRAQNKELEATLRKLEGGHIDARVESLQEKIRELEERLRYETEEKKVYQSKLSETIHQMNSMQDPLKESQKSLVNSATPKILRKRPNNVDRPDSSQERKREPVAEKHFINVQGDDELKRLLTQSVEEKNRLEKINKDLSNKIMLMMKTYEEEQTREINKEKKKAEYAVLATKREIEDLKRIKEENEKKLFAEIIKLEKKISEREKQIEVYGSGIETLKKELQLREDPSHSAAQVVKYLEKYSKFQNEFMSNEVKRFQDDIVQLKNDIKKRDEENEKVRKRQHDARLNYDSIIGELEMQRELTQMKNEEIVSLKQENNLLMTAMELLRKDKAQISNIRKANNELVVFSDARETN